MTAPSLAAAARSAVRLTIVRQQQHGVTTRAMSSSLGSSNVESATASSSSSQQQQHMHTLNRQKKKEDRLPDLSSILTLMAQAGGDSVSCSDIAFLQARYKRAFLDKLEKNHPDNLRGETSYSLSFSSPFSDITDAKLLSPTMETQLETVRADAGRRRAAADAATAKKERSCVDTIDSALPRTYEEAVGDMSSNQARVITTTEAPFEIVNVNDAWVNLCGYTKEEAIGQSLSMLQGPETDKASITPLLSTLLRGDEGGMVLTNYTKSGRKFHNRLRVAPLVRSDDDKVTHYVGVLLEVDDDESSVMGNKNKASSL